MLTTVLIHNTIGLFVLITLEIVLSVDNLVFIAVVSSRLPNHQQKQARQLGLSFALITRLLLLASVVWLAKLTTPLLTVVDIAFSGRDLLLLIGGIFLLYKGVTEIQTELDVQKTEQHHARLFTHLVSTVIQIALFDIIFSLDSVLTAIALTQQFLIMALSLPLPWVLCYSSANPFTRLIKSHPSIRILAWSFLLLIGVTLMADGLHQHISRGYIYFAVCFSISVEALNIWRKQRRK